ncbi:MAG: protease modulator HflC [Desulfobulbaceae bacterium]|jgi:membrane protease subunit HflC|nr:protease modulator HflC [Desulfobulbaceae bacterium]
MKNFISVIGVGLALLLLALIYDGLYILKEDQQVVVTQFGAPIGDPITQAGLHVKMPFLQQTNIFDKRIQIWDDEPREIPTNDKTFIFLDITARWRISDALQFMKSAGNEIRAQSLLSDIISGTMRDMVNKSDLIEIIRSSDWSETTMSPTTPQANIGGKPKLGRDKLIDNIVTIAQKATPQYGIELIDVMFKRVNYTDKVRATVYDRMISERKRIAAEKRSQGEGEKAEILGKVDRELKTVLSAANRQSLNIRGQADAEVTKIYGQAYSQDPEFFAFFKTIESYKKTIGENTTLVLSADSDLYRFLQSVKTNQP